MYVYILYYIYKPIRKRGGFRGFERAPPPAKKVRSRLIKSTLYNAFNLKGCQLLANLKLHQKQSQKTKFPEGWGQTALAAHFLRYSYECAPPLVKILDPPLVSICSGLLKVRKSPLQLGKEPTLPKSCVWA